MSTPYTINEVEKGLFLAYLATYDKPFALIMSPSRRGCRKWGIFYRDPSTENPFDTSTSNSNHETFADVENEIMTSSKICSPYQLGLA